MTISSSPAHIDFRLTRPRIKPRLHLTLILPKTPVGRFPVTESFQTGLSMFRRALLTLAILVLFACCSSPEATSFCFSVCRQPLRAWIPLPPSNPYSKFVWPQSPVISSKQLPANPNMEICCFTLRAAKAEKSLYPLTVHYELIRHEEVVPANEKTGVASARLTVIKPSAYPVSCSRIS